MTLNEYRQRVAYLTAESGRRALTEDEQTDLASGALALCETGAERSERIKAGHRSNESGNPDVPEIEGRPGEKLQRGQSMKEYVRRAAENGVQWSIDGGSPRPIQAWDNERENDYWGQRFGFARRESRALGEDTSGSGLAITPQSWTASVVEYLYADAVIGDLGLTQVAMPTEIYNVPVMTAPVAPSWLAENSTIGIDANPAFGPLQLNAQGGFKDITLFSVELAQDAYVSGTLPDFLARSCARNMALAMDVAAINGVSGNAGNPGLNAETGFTYRHYSGDSGTTGATIASTAELSVINEVVRGQNAHTEAYLMNHKVAGTLSRTTAGTFPMFWPIPADVADIPWVTTSNANVVPATETDPATASSVAQTGGTMSSIYAGPWHFGVMGVHLALETRPLVERYVDTGSVGMFSIMRASIRWAHPNTFVRTIGMLTT
jgi:HK97 family phage major capsid protein